MKMGKQRCFDFRFEKGKSSLGGKCNAHYVITIIESTKCSSIASIFLEENSNKKRGREAAIEKPLQKLQMDSLSEIEVGKSQRGETKQNQTRAPHTHTPTEQMQ